MIRKSQVIPYHPFFELKERLRHGRIQFKKMLVLLLSTFQSGYLTLPELETIYILLKHLNKLSGPKIDGLVGLNFLRHFQISLNFKKKKIYLKRIDQERLNLNGSPQTPGPPSRIRPVETIFDPLKKKQ